MKKIFLLLYIGLLSSIGFSQNGYKCRDSIIRLELQNSSDCFVSVKSSESITANQQIKKYTKIRNNDFIIAKEDLSYIKDIYYVSDLYTDEICTIIVLPKIVFRTTNDNIELEKIKKEYDITIEKCNESKYILYCNVSNSQDVLNIVGDISKMKNVLWCEPEMLSGYHSLNTLYNQQYYLKNTGQNGGTAGIDINVEPAWRITNGENVVVAVIDEGVDFSHEDLQGNILNGYTVGNPNGYGAPQNNDATISGSKGHGVACAGIIAAKDNNIGIKGIAYGAKILPVNIVPNTVDPPFYYGFASNLEIAKAINWAWKRADVLSCSWGGGSFSSEIVEAIDSARTFGRNSKGSLVIFASGNSYPYHSNVSFPADVSGVVTVGAIDKNGVIWNYSQRGPEMNLVAPSGNVNLSGDVVTTDRMGILGYNTLISNGNYTDKFGGTSAACPQVAGVAALLLSANNNLTELQVVEILNTTARDLGVVGFDNTYGYGLVDAYAAVVEACLYEHRITGDTNVNTCQISPFYYEGNLLDNFKIYWKVSPNCIIYSGQLSTHVEVVPLYGDTATLYAYIILNNDTLKVFSKKLSITDYNTNIVTPNLSNGIPLDSVWNTDYTLITSVTIPKGRKLTVNADVSCMPHVKIIVENGGRLVINNAEISSHCENILWRGIEVWGSPDTSQYYVSRNVTSPLQGEVVLNNAVIKDAICGVRVGNTRLHNYGKGGGVIKATNTQFVNNKEAVHFNAYIRVSNAHKVVDNISYFNECIFKVDNNAYFVVDTSNVQVALYNVRGVQFNGCQFEDMQTKSDWQNFGTAIYASQSGFRINEQTDMLQYPATYYNTPCTFNNYKNAIAIVGSAEKPIKIYNTLFSDNSTGVNAKNADALSIKSCSFSSGNESFSSYVHGLILDSCNFYRIENNQFTGIGNGIKIIGKTADNNTIRLNTFNSLCKAIEVYGKNGNENEYNDKIELTGLQFECNDFVTNSTDIYVQGQATIKRTQGSTSHACGNYFGDQSIMHFNNLNPQLLLIYFYNYNVNAQKPIRYNNIDTIGVTHDICGERHGYIGDSYYDMPKILLDYENLYDANFQLYVSALDNYNSTYEGISIDWNNITAIDVTSNPQLFDLIQLSELKNSLDETCIEVIHLLGNSTEVEITEITTWLQRLSSLNADLLGIHYIAQGNDISQLQLAWDQITQHYSIVNPEDTSYYQYCINQINTWARDTATDVNISQGAIDTLTAIANSNNTASPYAVSVLECINEHYPWWRLRIHTSCNWVFLVESMSPKKETEQGQTDAIQLHPNPTNGMIEIKSNNLNIKQVELFDIFGKLLIEKKANESTVTLDVSPYAKGMYLLRYTLSDDTQQTKKIIKE